MIRLMKLFAIISLLLLVSLPCVTHADIVENIPVCTAPDGQFLPWAVGDGKGGIVVVWEDHRTGKDWDVYAQRIDAAGEVLWGANGMPISRERNNQRYLRMVRSGDRMIVAWTDRRAVRKWDVYAQAITRSGEVVWDEGGIPVCTHPANQSDIAVVSDGAGGAIIAWKDRRRGSAYHNLYVQRIGPDGQRMWEIDGVPVFLSGALQGNPQLISDGRHGFYAVWWDVVGHEQWHIMTHRLNMSGKSLWKTPVLVSPLKGIGGEPRAASDGRGGLIVVWQIYSNFINDNLYAQRMDRKGRKRWGEDGVPICTAPSIQKHPSIASDGLGGIVAVWQDERDVYSDLYAQRIAGNGKPLWAQNGIPICVADGHQDAPSLVKCGKSEFFVAWLDYREDYGDESNDAIYAQRIDIDGKAIWQENGIPICTANGEQYPPFVVRSGSGELTVVWSDARGDIGDIYVQQVRD